jgi:hypothetical protein
MLPRYDLVSPAPTVVSDRPRIGRYGDVLERIGPDAGHDREAEDNLYILRAGKIGFPPQFQLAMGQNRLSDRSTPIRFAGKSGFLIAGYQVCS